MGGSQLFAITALLSAFVDFFVLAGLAWQYRATIQRSRALRIVYPISWAIFLIFGWTYWQILFVPENYVFAVQTVARPFNTVMLNTVAAIVALSTAHSAKIQAQARELAEAERKAVEIQRQQLAAEKQWLDERSDFLTIIGHEFRTPLAQIVGYLTMLADILPAIVSQLPHDEDTADQLQLFAEGAISGAARLRVMLRLFNATRDAPRIAPVNLCEIVYKAVYDEDLYAATRRKPEDVAINVVCVPLIVEGDAEMIETAVFELVRNALKATRKGFVKVEVSEAGEHAVIAIEDNGRGIEPGQARRIWEAGYQDGSSHLRRPNEGSGYGLPVVLHIAQAHGGDAALEWTEPGEGSRFAIYLPL